MKEQIIFKTVSGSKLYGTDSKNSDTDVKGVFLPDLNDLILGRAPKHYVFSTGKSNEKNNSSDIDETYYSLQYYLELLSRGDTTALDMLFAYTNQNAVIESSEIWKELVDNIDKVLTKNMKAYMGYCKNQSIKYSIKGEKLKNFNQFHDFCNKFVNNKNHETGERFTLKELMEILIPDFDNKYIPKPGSERIKFNEKISTYNFGEHCYIEKELNRESYISISDVKFSLNDTLDNVLYKIKKVIASYGKRAKNAAENNGADYKAISHAVRVITQVEELLKTQQIVFPLKNADFIKSIKYKNIDMSFNEIMNWIEDKIHEIDEKLLPMSNLPEKVNQEWIDNFILKCYKKSK